MADFLERISNLSPKKLALLANDLKERYDSLEQERREPIAIVGMGCRFPGADSPAEFWRLLHEGVDAISEVPPERWDLDSVYDPEPGKPGKISSRFGGFLKDVDQFDPAFFGISPREATSSRRCGPVAGNAVRNADWRLRRNCRQRLFAWNA
jgi:hypothetical protein